jgi:Zn-dependent peptidase ImmA (M78 family)/transcriptional regulator with XRE-family HTH domain
MRYENVDLAGLAERLVSARKTANVTQETAALHLGMSRPTFISMEKGMRRPKAEELAKLASLFKVQLNSLLRQEPKSQALRPHLRIALDAAMDGAKEVEAAASILEDYIDDYRQLERLIGAHPTTNFPPVVRQPPGSIERFAEHCAQEERARLDLGAHQPIYTLRNTLEESGISIFIEPLGSSLAGLYVFEPGFGYCILVNRKHPRERRRWTIAHEYGHFLMDRDRPGIDFSKPMQRKPEGERFADAFAAAFLMPEAGVQRRYYEEVERSGDFKVGDLCRMADYFGVSLMAMTLRLEFLTLIQRGSWDRISESRVPVRTLKKEAGVEVSQDADSVEAHPVRYKHLAVQAFVEERITEGQLSRYLRCSRIEARDMVEKSTESRDSVDSTLAPFRLTLARSLLIDTVRQ